MSRPSALDHAALDDKRLIPSCPADRDAVRQQLERILAHPHFKHSKRYPNLFRHIVESSLEGGGHLKERTLGVDVFGRDADYDTNEDPVVRITAGEIRKRIAQYYHEPGHEGELRIDLPPGSYAPEFHLPAETSATETNRHANGSASSGRTVDRKSYARRPLAFALIAVFIAAAAVGTARVKAWVSPRPIDDFWAPVLESSSAALVCIGEPNALQAQKTAQSPKPVEFSVSDHIYDGDRITFSDANALFRLASLLGSHGKFARLQTSTGTSLTDLRQGPVVLIAGLDNEWTMRVAQSLRYRVGFSPHFAWIEDRNNASRQDWSVDFSQKYSQLTQDYAIVSRFSDPTTGQPVVIAAGLGENGTIAAGEFLTDAREMQDATRDAPKNWRGQNVEFVLATQVIEEKSGRPRVLASYYW